MAKPTAGTTTSSAVTGTASVTFACTVSNGHNFLEVEVGVGAGSLWTVSSVTFNGVALTKKWGPSWDNNWNQTQMWYLANPPVGTFNVVVSLSGGSVSQLVATATPWNDVDTSNPLGTAVTASSASTSTPSTGSITSDADSVVIGSCMSDDNVNLEPDGTKLAEINDIATDTSYCSQYKTTAPATLNWTTSGIVGWACGGVSLHGTVTTTAAITGTLNGATEADVVAGGKTIVITLSGDTFIPG